MVFNDDMEVGSELVKLYASSENELFMNLSATLTFTHGSESNTQKLAYASSEKFPA